MRKILKRGAIVAASIAGLFVIALLFLNLWFPHVDPAPLAEVEPTAYRMDRGRYLAKHVTVCVDCHSTRDWSRFSGPVVPGTFGKGGEKFDENAGGVPGVLYAPNITSAGISGWTDGELMRAITNGITKDNRAIFPLMPYLAYQHLSREDLFALVVYIRSLERIENKVPASELNFPMNFIVKTIPPQSYTPEPEPDRSSTLQYGKYLVRIAACADCHTPADKGKPLPGMEFAGGFEFRFPAGMVRSANISPDPVTGIGKWTKEQFIQRFKSMNPDSNRIAAVNVQKDFNTPMPWTMYAGMKESDLEAIYEYLQTVAPVRHTVTRFSPNR